MSRGHFHSEQAALKCLYLVTRSLDQAEQQCLLHDGRAVQTDELVARRLDDSEYDTSIARAVIFVPDDGVLRYSAFS